MPKMKDEKTLTDAAMMLRKARRTVIKVGSALLVGNDGGLRRDRLAAIAADIANLRARNCETILVTSGAIAIGRQRLGLTGRLRLEDKQAAAAAGQAHLIEAWQEAFTPHHMVCAQILLTLDDAEDRRRYLNARATIAALLRRKALPVINENDTVATSEIRYGDNDRLSAHTALMAGADLLVLLSDIDGLYSADPRKDQSAEHIACVEDISPAIEAMAGHANMTRGVGSGGMATKIAAAKIAATAGCAVVIADGAAPAPIAAIEAGRRATLFLPHSTPERARRAWIGGRLKPAGALTIDAGAAHALLRGASLLPSGIRKVEGRFRRGDAVSVLDESGAVLGRGLVAYDEEEVTRIVGRKSSDIEAVLGYRRGGAVIHRDDLALAVRGKDKKRESEENGSA